MFHNCNFYFSAKVEKYFIILSFLLAIIQKIKTYCVLLSIIRCFCSGMDGYNKVSILFFKFGQDNLSIICRKDVHGHSLLLIIFSVYQTPTQNLHPVFHLFSRKSLHALDKEPKNLSMQGGAH